MGYKVVGKVCVMCGSAKIIGRSLCRNHYQKMWKAGQLEKFPLPTKEEAFLQRFNRGTGCWVWRGTKNQYGYGIFLLEGEVPIRAHRFSYEFFKGPIPDGLIVMHSCDNPPCVNPAHLSLGTRGDNNADTKRKRRHLYGTNHPQGRLTDKQVQEIRDSKKPQRELATIYGISHGYAGSIRRGEERPHRPPIK